MSPAVVRLGRDAVCVTSSPPSWPPIPVVVASRAPPGASASEQPPPKGFVSVPDIVPVSQAEWATYRRWVSRLSAYGLKATALDDHLIFDAVPHVYTFRGVPLSARVTALAHAYDKPFVATEAIAGVKLGRSQKWPRHEYVVDARPLTA